jgi:hypothetical protein
MVSILQSNLLGIAIEPAVNNKISTDVVSFSTINLFSENLKFIRLTSGATHPECRSASAALWD